MTGEQEWADYGLGFPTTAVYTDVHQSTIESKDMFLSSPGMAVKRTASVTSLNT
jgi:hypothetical protein